MKTYQELIGIDDYYERFKYLQEDILAHVGDETFGQARRWMNQVFYTSKEWRDFRRRILIRDNGCDMAHPDYPISGKRMIVLHHLNPITTDDILDRSPALLSPNNVVCVSKDTHNAIHYSNADILPRDPIVRCPGDTTLW